MRRLGLLVALLVCLAVLGFSAKPARAACGAGAVCTDNGFWSTTLTGPATAFVGQQVTYTATFASDGATWGCLLACFQLVLPAGASNIVVTVAGNTGTCAGATFANGPVTFTCESLAFSTDRGATFQPVALTVTLTLGPAAAGVFALQYRDGAVAATFTTVVALAQLPTNTFTPASGVGLNYSGQAWDPRCEFGCPPNGLP